LTILPVVQKLVESVLRGDRKSVARAITLVENNTLDGKSLVSQLYPHTGKARIVGVTGPSGAGKSTLVGRLISELRQQRKTVSVVAVDPTSPFSGGAFLGDRIRMQNHSVDEGVFIRSMATRNNPGGLARATKDAVRILDASGRDVVIVETAGAGQSEVDIIKVAQTVVVVLAPGLGDEIQAIKAGIMEIGDIFVVNKADRQNAGKTIRDIQAMLDLSSEKFERLPAIVKTVATTGEGVSELLGEIMKHADYLEKGEASVRTERNAKSELVEAIKERTAEQLIELLKRSGQLDALTAKIMAREIDPFAAAERVLKRYIKAAQKDVHP
jgi:LAO/AO transport system kinase